MAEQKPKCGAKTTRTGKPCDNPAGFRTNHPGIGRCAFHGGATRNHVKAARRMMAEQAVAAFGLPREIDPDQALMEELWRCAGNVRYFERLIIAGELPAAENPTGRKRSVRLTQTTEAGERPSAWYEMLAEERDRLHAVAKSCKQAGIEERQIRVVEMLGGAIHQLLRNVLGDLGVAADDPRVMEIVRKRLTEVAGE